MTDIVNVNSLVNNAQQAQTTTATTATTATAETTNAEGTQETTTQEPLITANVTNADIADITEAAKDVNYLASIGESMGLTLKGEDLGTDLEDIEKYVEKLDAMMTKIQKKILNKTLELERYNTEQEALIKDKEAHENELTRLNSELEETEHNMASINANIESINNANEEAQAEFMAKYNSEMANAEAAYNPETDGEDKEAFISEYMSQFAAPTSQDTSSLASNYTTLSGTAQDLQLSISVIQTSIIPNVESKIKAIEGKISAVTTELDAVKADKATLRAEMDSIPQKQINTMKSYVGEEEWSLIDKNNIDMSAKLSNGKPKYMIAKGKSDGKYHIYQWLDTGETYRWETKAVSLARLYGECSGTGPNGLTFKGLDLVPFGNGDVPCYSTSNETNTKAAETIQFNISTDQTKVTWKSESATYKTQSPLAFDMNGEGIQTGTDTIMFDIDGDGKLDEINNVFEGILAFDKNGDGIVGADGSELFGNNTDLDGDGKADGYKDGFEALKALAFKEGFINGSDDMMLDTNDIVALTEKYSLSMKIGGYDQEAQSLMALGITQINLAKTNETTLTDNFDGQGNQLMTQEGATFVQNGKTKDYVDVWNKIYKNN